MRSSSSTGSRSGSACRPLQASPNANTTRSDRQLVGWRTPRHRVSGHGGLARGRRARGIRAIVQCPRIPQHIDLKPKARRWPPRLHRGQRVRYQVIAEPDSSDPGSSKAGCMRGPRTTLGCQGRTRNSGRTTGKPQVLRCPLFVTGL